MTDLAFRIRTLALALSAVPALAIATPAAAQAWPAKPMRWIAPYPPGGSSDLVARAVGTRLAEQLGQPVLIDNRPGVGGSLGTELAARAAPDGYTMLLANIAPLAINPHIYPKLGYDVMRDFEAVSLLATGPTLLVVGPSLPVKNLQELIALAKAKPGAIKYGTGGSGTPAHLTTELLRLMTGIELLHVPYKGTGQSVTDLLGGQIDFVFASPPVAAAHVKSGKLRALAASSAKRTPLAPDIPTVAESGVPGFDMVTWWGAVVPAKTPAAIIDRLNAMLRKSLEFADTQERFAALGIDVQSSTPAAFRSFMAAELARYAKLSKQVGLKNE
ncbi:MAG: tripartite tricarboxylate transporter substrate binding protein [Burkholderiales bacterium]|nr:tripartite tricarboxylate transporter substrate binding protein [Burkholderiales bacterium]